MIRRCYWCSLILAFNRLYFCSGSCAKMFNRNYGRVTPETKRRHQPGPED